MVAQPIKNLLYCLGIAAVTFSACKKRVGCDPATMHSLEGLYTGRVISTSAQSENTLQTVLPANISFTAGHYSANNIPQNALTYTTFIPYTGTYQLQDEGMALILTSTMQIQPLPVINLLNGKFAISYKADSLILIQTLSDGSSYQYRLKKLDHR